MSQLREKAAACFDSDCPGRRRVFDILVDRKGGACVVTRVVRSVMSLSPLNAGYNNGTKRKWGISQLISGIRHQAWCSYAQFCTILSSAESGFGPQWENKILPPPPPPSKGGLARGKVRKQSKECRTQDGC
jgi:hypothetical protein